MLRCQKRKNESNYGIVVGKETLVVAGAFFLSSRWPNPGLYDKMDTIRNVFICFIVMSFIMPMASNVFRLGSFSPLFSLARSESFIFKEARRHRRF